MRKNKENYRVYDPEIMTRERPQAPRCLCRSWIHWKLDILSPSLVATYTPKSVDEMIEINDYFINVKKWRIYNRMMGKEEWKIYYREIREDRRIKGLEKKFTDIRAETEKFTEGLDKIMDSLEDMSEVIKSMRKKEPMKRDPRFLLDRDSGCYGCQFYKHTSQCDYDYYPEEVDENGGVCDSLEMCIAFNLNNYGKESTQ